VSGESGPTLSLLLRPRGQALRNAWARADKPRRYAIAFFSFLTLAFWVGVLAVCVYFVHMFHEVELFGPLLLKKALSMLLLSYSALLLFSNVVTALSSYFLSEDMQLIQSLPISPRLVFYQRLIDTMIGSSWMIGIFGLPVLFAYGIVYGAGPIYYAIAVFGLIAWLLPEAAIGVAVAHLLVRGFSAQRVKEALGLVSAVLVVVLLLAVRALKPERLVDPEAFETLAQFIAVVRAPDASWLPSTWLVDLCLWGLGESSERAALSAGLLFFTGPAAVVFVRWAVRPLAFEAWTMAQEAPQKRASRAGWVGVAIDRLTSPFPPVFRALLRKDLRLFLREAGQWTQGFMLLGLVAIYLYSVSALPLEQMPWKTTALQNSIAFLNVGVAGSVLAAIAVRFHFTAISREGRAFWVLHSSPIGARRYVLSKFLTGWLPTVLLGLVLVLATNRLLRVEPLYAWVAAATIVLLATAVSGMATGLGALYPDFKADSAAKMAAGPGAILFMVLALSFVAGVLVVEAVPVGMIITRQVGGRPVPDSYWAALGAAGVAVVVACGAAAWVPMRRGADALWGDLGNVGD
jgi:ABC-2 type transport system permease protein